jgi:hypothetical protein
MLNWLKQRPFLFVMILCLSVASYHLVKHRWKGDSWKSTIQSDGSGYYSYLPAVFIYQDLQYRFYLDLKEKYKFGDLSENFLYTENNRLYNRYFCGTSIAMMPFFLLGWAAAEISGQDADGHSFYFTVSLNVAAIFYVLSGLYLMYRLFSRRYNKWTVALICAAIFLGTNTFTYAIYHASYSHAYSFGFIALFIYLADRSIRLKTRKFAYSSGVVPRHDHHYQAHECYCFSIDSFFIRKLRFIFIMVQIRHTTSGILAGSDELCICRLHSKFHVSCSMRIMVDRWISI